ncbi:putative stage IV sporulation protein YqfD [Operophtera brumata]|uniref:Putative stage IV sporulation protein YqfD n=1 Tax=Operophtera brumata TaxID=104452 RepID=A0A0L7LP47_OPEBR|nr:putative stage IV sporulation protein YqfD [Operophtera brumata]
MPTKSLTYRQSITQKWHKPTKLKMYRCTVHFLMAIVILTSLPYTSLSLPNGDPAPGRSPGPPIDEPIDSNPVENVDLKVEEAKTILSVDYEETTTVEAVEVTSASEIEDACAFARIPSESDEIVTLSAEDSEVNVTVTHPVFEAEELVRGVMYDDKGHVT